MKVEIEQQVLDFVRRCAPDPRRALRAGLRGLERERGDIKPLEGPLQGYYRLRVQSYRIIFRYHTSPGHRGQTSIRCVFAERRSLIYEIFERLVVERERAR